MRHGTILGLSCLLAFVGAALPAQEAAPFDLILSGGTVHDGSGRAPFAADVAVRGDRIVAIGDLSGSEARRRIDVTGHVVAPGFIDTHAHADAGVLRRPTAHNFVHMGVTTIVDGNCGGSMRDLGNHFKLVAKRRVSVNYACLIGHNTVRREAMGSAARAPTAAELQKMRAHVDQAMRDGAVGMSTGLIYVPGTYAKTDELIELAKVVSQHGGIYVSHMRNENNRVLEAIDEAIEIGRAADLPIHLSHLKSSGRRNWGRGKAIVARLQQARGDGVRVTGDQYAYTASSTSIDVLFPSKALSIGREAFAEKLRDDAGFRDEMKAALLRYIAGKKFADFAWCQIAYARGHGELSGDNLKQAAAAFYDGDDSVERQADAAIKLFIDGGGSRISMVFHSMSEEDVETIMRTPFVGVACDAGIRAKKGASKPHPRGSGNNPRVLGRYVRERQVLPLELAVHKMTGLPARIFELKDRGEIRVGNYADITVFDAKTVADRATYEEPRRYPDGMPHVLVNGVLVVESGKHTEARPGHVLRRAK